MINKKIKTFLIFFISLIIIFFITYKLIFFIPNFLDYGKRNFAEKTIDFLCFGWHFTKASIYSDYLKNNEKANRELGKAGWYGKKYFVKKFGINEKDLFSVLEFYKNLDINSIIEKLYIILIRQENNEVIFFFEAGEKFITRKNWKMAARSFSKVTDANPGDVMGHYYLGLSHLNLKKHIKANLCFERAIELRPDFADAFYRLGFIAEKEKNWRKAKSLYEKAINMLPNHSDSLKALKKINEKLE